LPHGFNAGEAFPTSRCHQRRMADRSRWRVSRQEVIVNIFASW
jgi:hypothetical protein